LLPNRTGFGFADAVTRAEYLKMGRVYYGAKNILQWRVPPAVRSALQAMMEGAANGAFDPTRQLIFAISARKNDPEAALCRFLLWVAVQLNLLALTWDAPWIEAAGTLEAMEERAEEILRELLDVKELTDTDARPLHVLVAETALYMCDDVKVRMAQVIAEFGGELNELATNAEAIEHVRRLGDRDAVMFLPGRFDGQAGSQQTVDRFPQHFTKANTLDQQRRRLLLRKDREEPKDRLIDLLRAVGGPQ
jgi:hypothetical protein